MPSNLRTLSPAEMIQVNAAGLLQTVRSIPFDNAEKARAWIENHGTVTAPVIASALAMIETNPKLLGKF